ncbi:MAG: HAMP domain-containing sensor histidine kinase [Chloroflexota bacterium]
MSNAKSLLQRLMQNVYLDVSLTEQQKHSRILTLRRLLVIIFPMIFITTATRLVITGSWFLRSYDTVYLALILCTVLYLITRTNRYYLLVSAVIISSTMIIVYNAHVTQPPHIELMYLIIVPLVASTLLSFSETMLTSIFTFVIFAVFGNYRILPIDRHMFRDIFQMFLILNTFIIFLSYQRNRIERENNTLLRVEERSKTLEYLVNSISHDFKTPLTVISTSIHMIDKLSDDERVTTRTEKIMRQVTRLDSMVQSVLRLSKLEFDMSESLAPCHLGYLTQQAVQAMTAFSEIEQVTLTTDIDLTVSNIRAHPENILRIVTNLIDNAIRYTPAGGTVSIRVSEEAESLCLEVQDTGIGIAPENLAQIFEPFYRVDESRSTQTGGTGVGLSLVKRTVELYGASINVDSKVGEGSTFTVVFPHYGI